MTHQQPNPSDVAQQREIQTMLRLHDATSMAGSMGRFIMGLGVCLFMGAIVAGVVTFCLDTLAGGSWIGWSGWFLAYLVILVPLLIWQERKSRQDYLTESLQGVDPNPSSRGEYELNQAGIQVGMYAALLVWGPRALIDGIRGLRGQRSFLQKAVFDRASVLVFDLARTNGGIEIARLMYPPEDMKVFGAAVDLLDIHGWIGKSSDGRSLWLDGTRRRQLTERTARV